MPLQERVAAVFSDALSQPGALPRDFEAAIWVSWVGWEAVVERIDRARIVCMRAIEARPASALGWRLLAAVEIAAGCQESVESLYEKALLTDAAESWELWHAYAASALGMGRPESCMQILRRALSAFGAPIDGGRDDDDSESDEHRTGVAVSSAEADTLITAMEHQIVGTAGKKACEATQRVFLWLNQLLVCVASSAEEGRVARTVDRALAMLPDAPAVQAIGLAYVQLLHAAGAAKVGADVEHAMSVLHQCKAHGAIKHAVLETIHFPGCALEGWAEEVREDTLVVLRMIRHLQRTFTFKSRQLPYVYSLAFSSDQATNQLLLCAALCDVLDTADWASARALQDHFKACLTAERQRTSDRNHDLLTVVGVGLLATVDGLKPALARLAAEPLGLSVAQSAWKLVRLYPPHQRSHLLEAACVMVSC